jgi:amino acid permease
VLELVLRFLGPWGKTFYQTILMMLMFVGLIAYTQVFVNTFISQLFPTLSTLFPSLLFGLIAIPLSCVDLAEQISVQVIMSILRFLSLATLIFGTLVAIWIDPHPSSDLSSLPDSDPVPLYEFSGFGLMFTTAIFSQLFQHSVPGLIRPLQPNDKKHVSSIFSFALLTTGAIYIFIGIICSIYFRSSINQAINLNFVNYYWGLSPPHSADSPLQAYLFFGLIKFLSMLIVLFPALDTLSVFPLIANTLGNNFHAAFPKGYKQTSKYLQYLPHTLVDTLLKSSIPSASSARNAHHTAASDPHSSSTGIATGTGGGGTNISTTATAYSTSNTYLTRRFTLRMWRLLVAFPPVIISMYVTDLALTLQIAGACGVLVALVIPALLQYYSFHEVPDIPAMVSNQGNGNDAKKYYDPSAVYFEPNPYGGIFSHLNYVYLVLLIAFVALIVCIFQIISSLL